MNPNEMRVLKILKDNNPSRRWEFVPIERQAVKRPPHGAWVSYPDFEGYHEDTVVMLVEAKGYRGWFYNTEGLLGLQDRKYRNYFVTKMYDKLPIQLVFEIYFDGKYHYFWEYLRNIKKFKSRLSDRENWSTGEIETFREFRACDFRTDTQCLGK